MQRIVYELLADHFDCRRELLCDDITLEDLGADQLDAIELCVMFEIALDIEITDGETDDLKTVGEWVDYLLDHKGLET